MIACVGAVVVVIVPGLMPTQVLRSMVSCLPCIRLPSLRIAQPGTLALWLLGALVVLADAVPVLPFDRDDRLRGPRILLLDSRLACRCCPQHVVVHVYTYTIVVQDGSG